MYNVRTWPLVAPGQDVLTSASLCARLALAFLARLASRWMPGLFPEKA